ncbi:helix-turn-helix transcriptional regulator [Actinomadura sp. HBU206391]|uniref:helix-turn-helix transcriptional regulator n=1 Tax=Actinomadura sp. HBU206391 TaxID=2731692 RepID=UPI00164F3F0E|nr:AlpA family phage regulatory protein [Actinomadura sp. HBU206391]MBC6462621.1 AlpA family phage regulatory protein [Actinomadura sp. HBU206391]
MKATHAGTRRAAQVPTRGEVASPPDRRGDRLLRLPAISEITALSEATLRYKRHCGTGPPIFRLSKNLVCWESDLLAWIDEEAAKDAAAS